MGAVGVALSANLVTMFIFFEIITISTYPLVIHEQTPEALRAGHKYLAYLMPAGAFLLFGIMITYYLAGTTDFTPGGIKALATASPMIITVLFFAFLLGFMKAAWMPFHSWLPTAMIAPSPVSALLHAVAVVKAGVFGIVRIVGYVIGMDLMQELGLWLILAGIASFTMIVASFFAIYPGQPQEEARLLHNKPAILHNLGCGIADQGQHTRGHVAHTLPWIHEDNPLPLCRRHTGGHGEDENKRDGRHREENACDYARVQRGCHRHGWNPSCLRIHQQIISLPGRMGSGLPIWDGIFSCHPDKLAAGYSLFLSHNSNSVLQEACGGNKRKWRRKDKGGPTFGGHPLDDNCDILPSIFRLSKHVLYFRPCKNGYIRALRRCMKNKMAIFMRQFREMAANDGEIVLIWTYGGGMNKERLVIDVVLLIVIPLASAISEQGDVRP